MASLGDLIAWRDALLEARSSGVRSVQTGDKRTEFKSDAEMLAALRDLERQISRAGGATAVTAVRVSTSKGIG